MRSLISKGLDRAARYHDAYRADAGLAARSAGASSVGSLMTGGGSGVGAGRHISSPGNAADQYAYFSGYPYAIINVIANRLSAQPIRVARRLGRGGRPAPGRAVAKSVAGPLVPKAYHDFADELEVIPDHRINRLLDNPNELMVRHHLMYITFASLETTGRAYWWMFAGPNGDELWPLPTHWVEPVPGEERLFDFYRVSMPITGQIVRVPARQIVPFFFPDPSDPFGAYSPMQALARTVLTDHAYETAQRVSFQNGVNPGLAIIVGRPPEFAGTNQEQVVLTKEQRAQLVAAVKNQFRGVQKFDEPLILDALIKDVKLISPTPKEMAFKDSGPLVRDRLAQGFGMNPITLGEIEGANYASSGVADHHVCRSVFAPRTEMYSQTLTCYLPPYFGGDRDRNRTVEPGDLVVYQEPVVPSDPEMEAQREAADYAAAIISRNDIRRKRGLPPLHDGDNALTPAGWVPVLTEEQASQSRRPGGPKHFVPPAGKVTDDEGHEHGDDGGGGGGGDKPDKPPAAHDADHAAADHAAVHASWEAEDSARAARHSQEARDDTARQQAEVKAHDRRQEGERAKLKREHDREETDLVRGFEAADRAVLKAREKDDAATGKAREKEDAANEKKWDKEDAAVLKAREKEDKATGKAREKEDGELAAKHDREIDDLLAAHKSELADAEGKHKADSAALAASHAAERAAMEDRHEAELETLEAGTQAYNETAARQFDEEAELEARHDAEAEAVADALQDVKDRHEAALEKLEAAHEEADADMRGRWSDEDDAAETAREQEDEERRAAREKAVEDARDEEDEQLNEAREAEDAERAEGEEAARDAMAERHAAAQDELDARHAEEDDAIGERHAAEDAAMNERHEAEDAAVHDRRAASNPAAHAAYYESVGGKAMTVRHRLRAARGRGAKVRDEQGHEHGADGRFGSGGGSGGGSGDAGKVTHDSAADPAKVGHGRGGSVDEPDDAHAKRAAGLMGAMKKIGGGAVKLARTVASVAVQKAVLANAVWAQHGADIVDAAVDNADDWGKISNSHMVKEQLGMGGAMAAKAGSLVIGYAISKIRQAIAGKRAEAGKGHGGAWLKEDGEGGGEGVSIRELAELSHSLVSAMLKAGGTPDDKIPTVAQIADKMAEAHGGGDDDAGDDGDKSFAGVAARVKAAAEAVDPVQLTAALAVREAVAPAFHKVGQEAAAALRKALAAGGRPSPTELAHSVIDRRRWEEELTPAVSAALDAAVHRGALAEWELFRASGAARHFHARGGAEHLTQKGFPAVLRRTLRRVVEEVIRHGVIRAVVDNTLKLVEAVIRRGVDKGLTGPALADHVAGKALTGGAAERAADEVARTEGGAAVSGGQGAVRDEVARHGGVAGVRWVTRHDERVRPTHRAADGQTVRPGQPFVVGGYKCERPGDPALPADERVRCRCQAVTVYRDD